MPAKYEVLTASDAIDKSLHDSDIHYLSGDISNDNVSETIKWILSANLNKKPKKTRQSKAREAFDWQREIIVCEFVFFPILFETNHTIKTSSEIFSSGYEVFMKWSFGILIIGPPFWNRAVSL